MAITKKQLRQLVGQELAGSLWLTGTVLAAPAPTTLSFAVNELVDSGYEVDAFRDRYLYHVASQSSRRIKDVDHDTGWLTLTRALASAPTTGQEVEFHRFDPALLNQAINDGLSRCRYLDEVSVTPVTNQPSYSLSAHTFITEKAQVLHVEYRSTVSGVIQVPQDVQWFDVKEDAGTLTLWVYPPPSIEQNVSIIMTVKRGFGPLTAETDSVSMDERWARAAVRKALFELLIPSTSPGKERNRYEADLALADRQFRRYSRLHQVREPARLKHRNPMTYPGYDSVWRIW